MSSDDDDPEAALARYADELAAGIVDALPGWVVGCVEARMIQWSGEVPAEIRHEAEAAGEQAQAEVGPQIIELLRLDIDDQRVPPLSVLRDAVRFPTRVLEAAGVPGIVRDEVDERLMPNDHYGLAPANFADVDPRLHEPGMAWGAAKAYVHLARRRAEGRR
ncbi:MAG: hypothetical protein U5K29_13350 [Acidimicrobiales bacterium]|nr:hypothetical protein [Acidimicrobiales bacterium]